ncbi:MAG: ABC transporter ATP-binding protein [Raineya sp.]|nr:ABC transporter ATP-binding protein [Raineya sp.]MDW8296976.1 ABC transporter ATP-binding protein [Raineya sp.]
MVKGNLTYQAEPLLEVKNLSITFTTAKGTVQAVKDISFTVYKGETLGIVGESGSGKSVSSLAILRLIQEGVGKVTQGEIIFNSPRHGRVNLLELTEDQMRKDIRGNDIAMIFQEPMTSLNPVFTCGEQVVETILLHQEVSREEAKKRALTLFEKVKFPEPERIFKAYPHEISGGQKQRVMIAMALSCEPALLIADEPTTALDVTVQAEVLRLIQELSNELDMSVIFITHDLGVIAEIADRVLVMYRGNILEKNDTWELFYNPKHPYTKGLLACRPRSNMKMRVLPVVADFMEVLPTGEIIEKNKLGSVGEALVMNVEIEEDIIERKKEISLQSKPILEVRNLKKYFPVKTKGIFKKEVVEYKKAVDDVSFNVYQGETLGLVGESGCGKTTLGRMILHLIPPTEGEVIFEGKNIFALKPNEVRQLRKDMQIIFQDPYSSLNPRMPVGMAIMEPMRVFGIGKDDKERKEKVIELLETVSLKASHFNHYPHEFSGGQRQRIAIARALAVEPKFIVCDESVSALDVSVQAQVLNLLNELKEKYHLTYIFISHDLSVVRFMADRILVMNQGKIEEIGYSEDIYNSPQQPYTKRLIGSIPESDTEEIRKIQARRKEARLNRLRNKGLIA